MSNYINIHEYSLIPPISPVSEMRSPAVWCPLLGSFVFMALNSIVGQLWAKQTNAASTM